jgi:hypothetical protein
MVVLPVILAFCGLRHKDSRFKTSLGYITRLVSKKKKKRIS